MIKENELRIGNWVEGNSPAMQVRAVGKDNIELYMPDSEADNFNFYPSEVNAIPITPKILEKSEFKKCETPFENCFTKKPYAINFLEDGKIFFVSNSGESVKLQYLHQLQNLYFALTGTELEVKL